MLTGWKLTLDPVQQRSKPENPLDEERCKQEVKVFIYMSIDIYISYYYEVSQTVWRVSTSSQTSPRLTLGWNQPPSG